MSKANNIISLESVLLFNPEWGWNGNQIVFIAEILIITFGLVVLKSKLSEKLTNWIPESCIWVTLGIILKAISSALEVKVFENHFNDRKIILNILIPPIILEGSYRLYSKELLFQIFGILSFAVFGTAFSIISVGFGVYYIEKRLDLKESLLLATIVSAVDPVTVLAVFDQIQVTQSLYVLIFGESLLNDGVTLAAFDSFKEMILFDGETPEIAYVLGTLSVISKTIGGGLIGILYGLLSAIFSRLIQSKAHKAIPLILFAYASFITSEMMSFSGISGIIICGLMQRRYAFPNVGNRSRYALIRTTKFLANIGEAIIFILLGEASYGTLWNINDAVFITSVIFLCIISRYIMVFALGYLCNQMKLTHISVKHLFVISYGGLRGAMSYVMMKIAKDEMTNDIKTKLFSEATLAVILFTIYVTGATVRFVATALNLHASETIQIDQLLTIVVDRITQHATAGMESILGGGVRRIHSWIETIELFDNKYVRPYILKADSLKTQPEVKKVMKNNLIKEAVIFYKTSEYLRDDAASEKKVISNIFPEPNTLPMNENGGQMSLYPINENEKFIPLTPNEVMWLRKLRLRRKVKSLNEDNLVPTSLYSSEDEE